MYKKRKIPCTSNACLCVRSSHFPAVHADPYFGALESIRSPWTARTADLKSEVGCARVSKLDDRVEG